MWIILQIGPDTWVRTIFANGNGTYDVVTKSGPSGDTIGFDGAGAAALLGVEDGQAMLRALADARDGSKLSS